MVAWRKLPHSKTSFKEIFLETHTKKTSEVPSVWSPKRVSKIKTSFFPPTITHSNWNTCLRSWLCLNTSSLPTPLNPALTQPTSPLIRDPPFDKSNFICPMGSSPNLKRACTFLLSHSSWSSIPCFTHSPFALQTSCIPNYVVYGINSGCTKPSARILALGPLHVSNHVDTLDQSTVTPLHKRTPWHLIFFLSATIPATPHSPEFTDRYFAQYVRLSFSLHFMIHTAFLFSFPCFHILFQGLSRPTHATIPDPTDIIFVSLTPPSLSHSLDLGFVEAQWIMFMGRFIV